MRKFVVAFDGLKYSQSARNHAIRLAKENEAHLVAVFLNDFTHHTYKIYDLVNESGEFSTAKQKKLFQHDEEHKKAAVDDLKNACWEAGLNFTIHHDHEEAIDELLRESIYADLLIVDKKENMTFEKDPPPTSLIRDLLPQVQCPVLVVPHHYHEAKRTVILYDGEPSSVMAAKMYSYTLPFMTQYPIEVITVRNAELDSHVPNNTLVKEFMKRHFPDARFNVLKGIPEDQILNYLIDVTDNPIVVLGAYRRSRISRWFKPSMADMLMRKIQLPLFIAHN